MGFESNVEEIVTLKDVKKLLSKPESETLDFKAKFHENNLELLHDILCLANANSGADRFLVFGVEDKTKNIRCISKDENKKEQSNICDLLKNACLNKLPDICLKEYSIGDKKIAVLRIFNSKNQPFFASKDKREGKKVLRAGVIYTRFGDTNTPLNESASEEHMELMWKKRFELDVSPLERMGKLLNEKDCWMGVDKEYFHKEYPEFTVKLKSNEHQSYDAWWLEGMRLFKKPAAIECYKVNYNATTLGEISIIRLDQWRYLVPEPLLELRTKELSVRRSSLAYKIAVIICSIEKCNATVDNILQRCEISIIE